MTDPPVAPSSTLRLLAVALRLFPLPVPSLSTIIILAGGEVKTVPSAGVIDVILGNTVSKKKLKLNVLLLPTKSTAVTTIVYFPSFEPSPGNIDEILNLIVFIPSFDCVAGTSFDDGSSSLITELSRSSPCPLLSFNWAFTSVNVETKESIAGAVERTSGSFVRTFTMRDVLDTSFPPASFAKIFT